MTNGRKVCGKLSQGGASGMEKAGKKKACTFLFMIDNFLFFRKQKFAFFKKKKVCRHVEHLPW